MLDAALAAVTTARESGQVAVLQAVDNRTVRDLNARAHTHAILSATVDDAPSVGRHAIKPRV